MFAIDIKVSPFIPLSIVSAYFAALLLLIENGGEIATTVILSALLSAHAVHTLLSHLKRRIRRIVFTATRSILIYESAQQPLVHASPPTLERCGEFLIILSFTQQATVKAPARGSGTERTVLRLWPDSLDRPQASRLRTYLKSLESDLREA
ncbi:hypothetical protein N9X99_02700 [Gammaproteobacteria bacterium]|nr:hypothetical protein [Gammaproteobacteria bacterium]